MKQKLFLSDCCLAFSGQHAREAFGLYFKTRYIYLKSTPKIIKVCQLHVLTSAFIFHPFIIPSKDVTDNLVFHLYRQWRIQLVICSSDVSDNFLVPQSAETFCLGITSTMIKIMFNGKDSLLAYLYTVYCEG